MLATAGMFTNYWQKAPTDSKALNVKSNRPFLLRLPPRVLCFYALRLATHDLCLAVNALRLAIKKTVNRQPVTVNGFFSLPTRS